MSLTARGQNLPSGNISRGKRKNVSIACSACKTRKSKCSGQQPCESCVKQMVECVFDEDGDKRRKLLVRRQIQALEGDRDLLFGLIHTIQESDEDELLQLLRRFQTNISLDEVKDYVNDRIHHQVERAFESTDLTSLSLQRVRRKCAELQHLRLLHKDPLCYVHSIGQWTSIVDDATASHLFTLYFNWEDQIWHFIDRRLFLQDLNAGRCRFCSPLLVHTVLFYACRFSYDLERPWDRNDENKLGNQLFQQIIQLWYLEKSQICLTTLQSSILLGNVTCASAQGRLGVRFIESGCDLPLRIGVHTNDPECFAPNPLYDPDELRRAHKRIAWGIFDFQATLAQGVRQQPLWPDPPQVSFSETDATEADKNQRWTPYPFKSPSYRSSRYATLYSRGKLAPIINEITNLAITCARKPITMETWRAGESLYNRLLAWKADLSGYLDVEDRSPPVLCLHMSYHITIMSLCEIFGPQAPPAECHIIQPQKLTASALELVGSLILLYRASHGWKYMPVVMMHYFVIIGMHSLHRLQTINENQHKWAQVLAASVSGLWHMHLSWPFCRFFIRTIQLVLKSSNISDIPAEVETIFGEIDSSIWTPATAKSLSSAYIIHQLPAEESGGIVPSSPSRVVDTECVEDVINALDSFSVSSN